MNTSTIVWIIVAVIVILGGWYWWSTTQDATTVPTENTEMIDESMDGTTQ